MTAVHQYGYTVLIVGDAAGSVEAGLRRVAVDVCLGHNLTWPVIWAVDPDLIVLACYPHRVPEDIADAYQVIGAGLVAPRAIVELVRDTVNGTAPARRADLSEFLDAEAQANRDPRDARTDY